MEKLRKKVSGSSIAIVILSVLLVIAFTTIGTFAWFASKDNADKTLTMGEAVNVSLVEKEGGTTTSGVGNLDFTIPTDYLLPGMWILTDTAAKIEQSNTKAFLRVKIDVTDGDDSPIVGDVNTQFVAEIARLANINGWYQISDLMTGEGKDTQDPYFYYLGKGQQSNATSENATLAEINCVSGAVTTSILGDGTSTKTVNNCMQIPTTWTNDVAEQTIKINVQIEAIQSWIPKKGDVNNTTTNKVAEVQYAFEEAALQA